jgi:hypothetical protein
MTTGIWLVVPSSVIAILAPTPTEDADGVRMDLLSTEVVVYLMEEQELLHWVDVTMPTTQIGVVAINCHVRIVQNQTGAVSGAPEEVQLMEDNVFHFLELVLQCMEVVMTIIIQIGVASMVVVGLV